MKDYKKLVVVLLILLQVVGWYSMFDWVRSTTVGVSAILAEAKTNLEGGLYQKALQNYDDALAKKDTLEIRLDKLTAYEAYSKANRSSYKIRKELEDELETTIVAYPKKAAAYEKAVAYYYDTDNNKLAIQALNRATANDVTSNVLHEYTDKLRYLFDLSSTSYLDFHPFLSGSYAVSDGESWFYIDATGNQLLDVSYTYAGQFAQNLAFVRVDTENHLIDTTGFTESIPDSRYQSAGVYNDDLIPAYDGTVWDYLGKDGKKVFGGYQAASTFANKQAAVKQNDLWGIIAADGTVVHKPEYQDIALDFAGCFNQYGVMLIKQNNRYGLYASDFTPIGSFSAVGVDKLSADGFAFFDGAKWGFADLEGNILVKPTYENAHSFNNGFAAVCQNGKWGFIKLDQDNKPNLVIDYAFADADYFNSSHTCMVKDGDTWNILRFLVDEVDAATS